MLGSSRVHIVFTPVLFRLRVSFFCVMDGKIEQPVCIKFCVKLGKSATETLEMLREAFGEYSLSRTAVFEWHSRFKAAKKVLKGSPTYGCWIHRA
jgi:hypothetical protein